ncbi:2-oxo acid dehydrogenase subunit E2 [Lacisediminihabitans profunda]|uniref:Dihydrolipoamide acetyltransferase component of pyruvate dehydrogenase complex n=1 Tax=Lacisediminihabitans profunda TaxID=2594790 RepID=A0A5C8US68_9MICO|nr:2-oxo acid dehydrogenase subunit E2 [Lacisediminihabitans profunda]TXN31132.1 2-oxo acid dehydrogenase subunit E2 [Lacisediminihabitans profunda]
MAEFLMPSLGADMERGKLVEWLVKPGDYVHKGDIVAAVDTDKTVMDVESFDEGVVAELLVEEGVTVPVGAPLARITQTPAAVDESARPAAKPHRPAKPGRPAKAPKPIEAAGPIEAVPPAQAPISPPVRQLAHRLGVELAGVHGSGPQGVITRDDVERAVPSPAAAPAESSRPERIRSSPRARRLAAELGIDLAGVVGTGPHGEVTGPDITRAREPVPAAPGRTRKPGKLPATATAAAAESAERSARLRRSIGVLMARSKKSIPHYYLSTTIDLRAATAWLQSANAQRSIAERVVPAALLLKATALAARDIPEMNGFYADDAFQPSSAVHLGVAVALRQGGLVAPAIHDADSLSLDDLMAGLRDLVGRARSGRLQRAEMTDPTITVTNLGDLGVESVFGVIYPPQVALVGFGRVLEQPWAHDGMLGVRTAVTATLSADHRVSDGLRGARFLARIDELLQKPEEL